MFLETDLVALNQKIAVLEQERGRTTQHFFTKLLSDQLLFRRANGRVIGKADFLQSLSTPSPFTQYKVEQLEQVQLAEVKKRTLVTLLMRTEDRYGAARCFRHIRYFTRSATRWRLEFWYVYEDVCA
jgi:hypothetical protein